jgi:lysophospholipase L1-like esterase
VKKVLFRLLAVLAGILFGLLLAEGLVRLVMPDPGAVKTVQDLRPRERSLSGGGEPPAKQGQVRIAVLGDSYVYGQGVDFTSIFAVRTGEILRRARPERTIEMLNFGRPGADTVNELRTLQQDVLPYDPDIVVLGFVLNDFTYRRARSEFTRVYRREKNRFLPFRKLERHSRLAYFLDWTFFQLFSDMDRVHNDYLDGLFDPEKNPEFPRMRAALDELLRLMAPRRGIVLLFPMFVRDEENRPFYRDARKLLTEACRENGVALIEMLPHFAGRAPAKWWASLEDHHPNAEAHAVIARVLSDHILREKLF